MSVIAVLYPRWPPLLKIEISSNGQNCSILSQNVPKFELYKHNDELFNIYCQIFYELWTFADFDRLCKLEKRGDEIFKKSSPLKRLSQSQPNFAEMILGWSSSKIVSGISEIPIKIFLSETICSIRTTFWWNSHWMVLFQNSGTSSSIRTKLWWNSHWMVLFQNCVRQSHSPTTVQLRCYWKQLWSR